MEKQKDFFEAHFTESHYEVNNGVEDREKINLILNNDGTAKVEHVLKHAGDPVNDKNVDQVHSYCGKYDVLDRGTHNARIRLNIEEKEGQKLGADEVKKELGSLEGISPVENKDIVSKEGGKDQSGKLTFDVKLDLFNNSARFAPDNFLTAHPHFLFHDYF